MLEIFIVLCLVVLNGVFALSELAIVSSRLSKLRSLAEAGRKGAKSALALADNPGRFARRRAEPEASEGRGLAELITRKFVGAALCLRRLSP